MGYNDRKSETVLVGIMQYTYILVNASKWSFVETSRKETKIKQGDQ